MAWMRIVVTGLIGSIPLAGLTLHYLQYFLGLVRLGHEVLYLEDTGTWCYDPVTDDMLEDSSGGVGYLEKVMRDCGHSDDWTFVAHDGTQYGKTGRDFKTYIESADLLINVTGAGLIREDYLAIASRVYIDTDPGFIQLRLANESEKDKYHLGLHTSFFTFGCNIGHESCPVPTGGFDWKPTVQPIFFDLWSPQPERKLAPYTTIMKWKSYQPEELDGVVYGLKDQELDKFLDLPLRTGQSMELAINGDPPEEALRNAGWKLRQALEISQTIEAYSEYLGGSRGEWSIAKNAYVSLATGWFSERSACYLASGRPVVVQETGFSEWLDAGGIGVCPFSDVEEACDAINRIESDYALHSTTAIAVAREYFDSDKVLGGILDNV